MSVPATHTPTVGPMLRTWRQRRHLSQLDLANLAGVTARHLSFVETGRARPSREMVLHLAETLDVPLRDRNALLLAAGHAPTYPQSDLASPPFETVRAALEQVLTAHEPYPAIVVDRHWNLVSSNVAATVLVEDVAPALLEPPANVLRVALHPDGLGRRIRNLDQWSVHILDRLRRQELLTGDAIFGELFDELAGLLRDAGVEPAHTGGEGPLDVATPMLLDTRRGPLALITMVATFGTPLDVTLAELSLETFLPLDAVTVETLNRYAAEARGVASASAVAVDGDGQEHRDEHG
jgi:transcriptional regulator with XRE-family HTH domain